MRPKNSVSPDPPDGDLGVLPRPRRARSDVGAGKGRGDRSADKRRVGPGSTTANLATGTFVFEFSGTGSHLGKFTATTEGTIVPTGPGTFALSGNAILVAANGDQLTATATATVTVNGPVSGVATITGGTGRFEDASGTLTLEDAQEKLVSFDGVTAVFTGEPTVTGRISY